MICPRCGHLVKRMRHDKRLGGIFYDECFEPDQQTLFQTFVRRLAIRR